MRIFLFLVSLSYILETTRAIRCLTCTNARSNAQCKRLGKVVECQINEDACLNEIRRDDRGVLITKRCKQSRACVNNFVQNQRDAWVPVQCNMARKNTVCRCCCYNDKCNLNTHECPNDCAPPEPLTNGAITCSFAERETEISSQCFYNCNEGYQLIGDANTTCVRENYRSYFTNPAPRCVVPTCMPQTNIHNGEVTCTNGSQHGSICQFKCDHGFVLFGSQTTTCGTDNSWSHKRPYCVSIRCHPEAENIERGTFECTNHNLVGSVCTYTCEPGFIPDGKTTMTCNEGGVDDTLGVWSNDTPSCNQDDRMSFRSSRPPCDPEHVDPVNGGVNCTDSNNYNSVCSFVCNEGHVRVGEPQSTCLGDEQAPQWSTPAPICELDASAPRDTGEDSKSGACHPPHSVPDNGNVTCTNNNFYDSICTFQCDLGFEMVGEEQSTCTGDKQDAVWSSSPAMCDAITCFPDVFDFRNMEANCTDGNNVFSLCSLTCLPNMDMIGPSDVLCDIDGTWSEFPTCVEEDGVERSLIPLNITAITCNDQGPLENGRYDCSEGNDVGSTCKFVCDEGYFLHPQHTTSNTCTKKFSVEEYGWNQPMPCCALGTPSMPGSYPPGAILDVVIALDNPASAGFRHWMNQRRFEGILRRKLKEFSELTKIGDVSYKTRSQGGPQLDYPDTPYFKEFGGIEMVDGPVYHVGVALQQIREISFTKENGDRPEAANVAVVVTIGNVPDQQEENWIFENALHLRDDGVRVYAVGIGKGEKLRNTLNDITGYEDSRTFQFDDYNELLTAADRISQAMAPNLCTPRHPTH